MKPVSKPTSSIAPNSTNINNNSITVLDDDAAATPSSSSSSSSTSRSSNSQHQQRPRKDAAAVSKQQRLQPQAASDVSRCSDTCSFTASESAAPITRIGNDTREQQLAVTTAGTSNYDMDVPDSGNKSASVMPPPALQEDDPYAELERILEKAQAEISEMFAQTVQAEKLKASTSSAGTLESEEGGPLKRKSGPEQTFRDGRGGVYPQRQHHHHHHHHPQHDASHHHIKYATIPHGNVASQNNIHSTLASSTSTGRRKQAENGEAKRTRNTFDPRYRSNELDLVVSSTTMAAVALATTTPATTTGAATGTHSSASSLLQTSSDSSNASGPNGYCGGRTELSDSLSDDMSLLEVGTPYDEGQECAGDDTSDELAMHSIRRYPNYHTQPYHHHHHHHHPVMVGTPGATMAVAFRPSSSGFYRKHHDDSPPTDRRLKTSTNSLPSVAVASASAANATGGAGSGGGHRNLALHLKFKSHQSAIDAKRKQFFLALDQEPFQPLKSNMADLPSPSSTSLHSGHNHLIAEELGCKSSSAPVLKDEGNALTVPKANLRYSRSQSDRHLAEIEAIEACRWLRAAGFPQYAQMYEDHQFPIDVENVEKDHPFLENDPLQSLFRRLHTLNRCANMHLDAHQHHTPKPSQREDSDDDSCALSEAWTFQHNSRRWSRVDDAIGLVSVIANKQKSSHPKDGTTKGAATGGDLLDPNSNGSRHSRTSSKKHHQTQLVRAEDHEKLWLESGGAGRITIGVPSDTDSQDDSGGGGAVNLRRTGSERLKDGAKAILRHVESIRSRRRKKQHREGLIILAPPASHHHLSPHRNGAGETGGEMGGGYLDIMSYSNPTSPRPSAEMLQFDDGLAMDTHHRHCFPGATPADGIDRNLLSPYLSNAANAWSPAGTMHGGDTTRRGTPNVLLPFQVQLQQQEARSGDDSSSICSEDSGGGPGVDYEPRSTVSGAGGRAKYAPRAKKALRSKVITSTVDDYQSGGGALSDSEYQSKQRRSKIKSELDRSSGADSSVTSTTAKSTTSNTLAPQQPAGAPSKLHRGGSLNLGKASKRYRDAFSNRSVRHSGKAANEEWDGGTRGTSKRSTVARWHSFQQPKVSPSDATQQLPTATTVTTVTAKTLTDPLVVTIPSKDGDLLGMRSKQQQQQKQAQQRANQQLVTSSNTVSFDSKLATDSTISSSTGNSAASSRSSGPGLRMTEMSCGQLLVVRKLGLANLTGYMERYCPTHRSGWNWDLPKFIKRIKTPDYKDRRVFGMPLVLNLQRYGSTVPYSIRMAFSWLEQNALDQVGLFRKPGVKSRIAKLKSVIEASNDVGCRSEMFDEYHAYDVADLLKQYFRELPDVLLTAKLSETFIAIFQYLPDEVRAEAIQSAILLLPDEHREVLHLLLTFLEKVVQNSSLNQMTANNLAVCFAPSLFYLLAGNRYTAASPRRKKTGAGTGQPDERELSEAKASHECLAYMIERFQSLWTITSDQMRRCNFNYMDESKPVPLASLGAEMHVQNWRGYLSECLNECLREGRERPRGWVSLSSTDPSVAVFFKKVGDGHPLRLWKCVTEVEAPPVEVIQHIVNERPLWDAYLLKWRTIEQLDQDADVFQYACGQPITEYCVVRQWKNDLPRGACVIVELSISHDNATPLLGGVSGVVLASRYLIEPCGSGRCKLMHLSRVDMKGRTPDWYNKNYGHICQQYLSKIKKFFQHCTEGPETKV
ncbi:uncharacterized protein LOC125956532 [Anopheles darlingi]|uniref:uncharacterized protein LOC125956532 n=1 Tax=Anopheles darlingi TaxID=43151 RepID=UPI002100527D|nr:uncharacterized protein LOC125956532 [Anopheles darlingi]XP_049544472.1 uncharacterized protein LOC125956532 [Anopheles darlingi]XP_049544473.1 uncharacterized protein LOC125956532 [Anopheles darlingi]XP_049544475.1 uncharacterized protein LOC125956532 [Anopheles darlingi]XP_049544476.1 uncharacterized protein LOC125956532 [Anopheles darlingi]XP_049544477.1 uncharacterized protein LOC125956532 [Anopheles darlingi]XP_049544478.1 uncharacterized protein LOC125956532 [Anopheles darlingi]XP_0